MRVLSLFVILLVLTGCPPQEPAVAPPEEVEAEPVENDAVDFSANLQGQPGFEALSGTVMAHVLDGQTHIEISISGASPNAAHPWHVHAGTCATGGPIVGAADAYPVLAVDAAGVAAAEATIDVRLDPAAAYHVNVHGAPGDLATIAACGDVRVN